MSFHPIGPMHVPAVTVHSAGTVAASLPLHRASGNSSLLLLLLLLQRRRHGTATSSCRRRAGGRRSTMTRCWNTQSDSKHDLSRGIKNSFSGCNDGVRDKFWTMCSAESKISTSGDANQYFVEGCRTLIRGKQRASCCVKIEAYVDFKSGLRLTRAFTT
jgi:hypothetical protein